MTILSDCHSIGSIVESLGQTYKTRQPTTDLRERSEDMTNNGVDQYYWCLSHHRVETDDNICAAVDRLGPYASPQEAEQALDRVRQRNETWDAEDARWNGEDE